MSETKTDRKWWWAWEPEKIEDWLEAKEAQGWHAVSGSGIGVKYCFVRGVPRKVRYCADYQNKVTAEYERLFNDAGWELLYKTQGWYIWRKNYDEERPEIYYDVESAIDRNQRVMMLLIALGMLQLPCLFLFILLDVIPAAFIPPAVVFYGIFFSFIGYCTYNLYSYSNRLKAKRERLL